MAIGASWIFLPARAPQSLRDTPASRYASLLSY